MHQNDPKCYQELQFHFKTGLKAMLQRLSGFRPPTNKLLSYREEQQFCKKEGIHLPEIQLE